MFKKRIKTTLVDEMIKQALSEGDYEAVRILGDMESDIANELLKREIKGIFRGYGSAIIALVVGLVINGVIEHKKAS